MLQPQPLSEPLSLKEMAGGISKKNLIKTSGMEHLFVLGSWQDPSTGMLHSVSLAGGGGGHIPDRDESKPPFTGWRVQKVTILPADAEFGSCKLVINAFTTRYLLLWNRRRQV